MALKKFAFKVLNTDNYARLGIIETHRGKINTPAFMPVGTQATVKACKIEDIKQTGSEIILSNTYHLMIRPGVERIQRVGGLHQFMNCDLPILTDSGGFQVMSLSKLNKIDREKGAIFNSHIDGKKFYLSPEESIKIQLGLNSDILMIMDECPKKSNDYDLIRKSMNLSLYWAERSKKAFGKNPHKALFGIIQGGLFKDLRIKSLKGLSKINFDGYAIGGLAVGETQKEMFLVLDDIKNKPFMKDCWVWLYRGAWHEWPIHLIDMAVPMSPNQVLRKRKAIFYHQTQKDNVMFQGDDNREFWVRTEDRNRAIAKKFRDIGMSDYTAIETFKRYHF